MAENYEFTSTENEKIGQLAGRMKFVGITFVVFACLAAVAIFAGEIGGLIRGIFYLVVGIWTLSAAKSFRRIVDTQGNDIEHLMEAVGNLRKLYTLQMVLVIVAIVLMVIGIILGIARAA